MNRKYLLIGGLIVVLAGGTLLFVKANNYRMPVTMPEFGMGGTNMMVDDYAVRPSKASLGSMAGESLGYQVMPPYYGGNDALSAQDRQYQTYASYSVVVDDVSGYLGKLRETYLGMEGRVLQMSTNSSGKYQSGYLTAKVPIASFDTASQETTKGVRKIVSQSLNATDVTGVAVSQSDQMQKLEDQKTQKEVDLLAAKTDVDKKRIQLEITRLQTQIDALKKQQQNQQEQVQYATISVSAASSENVYNPNSQPDLGDTFRQAIDSVTGNLLVVAQFFIWAAVYAVVLLPAVWLIGKLRQSKKPMGPA